MGRRQRDGPACLPLRPHRHALHRAELRDHVAGVSVGRLRVHVRAARIERIAGFFSGWLILLDYILVPSLLYLFSAAALRPIFPGVPVWLWLGAFISFNAAVNMIGIQFTARVNRYMLVLELLTLGLFLVLGLITLYSGAGAGALTLKPIYDPQVFSFATVAGATSIAVLSFLGFDGISTLSEENRGKQNAVGRATLIALVLIGALFMLQTWVATDLAQGMHFTSPNTAFYEIAERAGGTWLRAHRDSRDGDRAGNLQRHGRAGRRRAHPFCNGEGRQIAGDTGQSASSLSNSLCEHARGGVRIDSGRAALFQPGR